VCIGRWKGSRPRQRNHFTDDLNFKSLRNYFGWVLEKGRSECDSDWRRHRICWTCWFQHQSASRKRECCGFSSYNFKGLGSANGGVSDVLAMSVTDNNSLSILTLVDICSHVPYRLREWDDRSWAWIQRARGNYGELRAHNEIRGFIEDARRNIAVSDTLTSWSSLRPKN